MPLQYQSESLATLRRRVGALVFGRNKFGYGTASAGTSTTVTLETFRTLPDEGWVGKSLYIVDGTGAGQERDISDSVRTTGIGTVPFAFTETPDNTSVIEIWPEHIRPADVNAAINLAILKAGTFVNIYQELTAPTLDTERRVAQLDSSFIKIIGSPITYLNAGSQVVAPRLVDWLDPIGGEQAMLYAGALRLFIAIPSDVADEDIRVRGYRKPAILTADADLCEVPSGYIVPMAAYMLDASMAGGQSIDPENHAGRASAWLSQAMSIETITATDFLPGTTEVLA